MRSPMTRCVPPQQLIDFRTQKEDHAQTMRSKKPSFSFFTFIKVFIVLSCTYLIFAIFSAGHHSLESAKRMRLMVNGQYIYTCLFVTLTDSSGVSDEDLKPSLPLSDPSSDLYFESSTDYFVHLVIKDISPPNPWKGFSCKGLKPAPGSYNPDKPSSAEAFKLENNAWSVVTDLDIGESDAAVPFLITRNLQARHLMSTAEKPVLKGVPYEDEAIVIIRAGGGGEVLTKRNILWENINPTGLYNKILHP
ncbi:hypothetical protein P0Y35_14025 [Kiritimatiellaeota bacterium B1221]|nr:hypothetical protein [Kiritimatiellaeota bacterium B1221]